MVTGSSISRPGRSLSPNACPECPHQSKRTVPLPKLPPQPLASPDASPSITPTSTPRASPGDATLKTHPHLTSVPSAPATAQAAHVAFLEHRSESLSCTPPALHLSSQHGHSRDLHQRKAGAIHQLSPAQQQPGYTGRPRHPNPQSRPVSTCAVRQPCSKLGSGRSPSLESDQWHIMEGTCGRLASSS